MNISTYNSFLYYKMIIIFTLWLTDLLISLSSIIILNIEYIDGYIQYSITPYLYSQL